jgi:hypothetical protein
MIFFTLRPKTQKNLTPDIVTDTLHFIMYTFRYEGARFAAMRLRLIAAASHTNHHHHQSSDSALRSSLSLAGGASVSLAGADKGGLSSYATTVMVMALFRQYA